jgi:hypothetical protein
MIEWSGRVLHLPCAVTATLCRAAFITNMFFSERSTGAELSPARAVTFLIDRSPTRPEPAHHPGVRARVPAVVDRAAAIILAAVLAGALAPGLSHADGVVTTTNEMDLAAALQGGGVVTFEVDGVIPITRLKRIQVDTVLDATSHHVTLQGAATNRLVEVNSNVSLTIVGLGLSGGTAVAADGVAGAAGESGGAGQDGGGAALYLNPGARLVAVHVLLGTNSVTGGDGGAGGVSSFGSVPGGAGGGAGAARGGAIFSNGGEMYLTNCTLIGNSVKGGAGGGGGGGNGGLNGSGGGDGGNGGSAGGGAIYAKGGMVRLVGCTLSGNQASGGPGGAGGLGSGTFTFNGANGSAGKALGGAVFSDGGQVECVSCTFDLGSVTGASGSDGKAAPRSDPGEDGRAGAEGHGGAVALNQGSAAFTNCTFYANAASGGNGGAGGQGGASGFGGDGGDGGNGGEAAGGGIHSAGSAKVVLVNCTLASNLAVGGTGGAGGAPGTGLAYRGANGTSGQSLGGALANSDGTVTLVNTLLANSPSGDNASGLFFDNGHNLSSDATPAFPAATSLNSTNARLGPLAANGGPTKTVALQSLSPAIDRGDPEAAPPADQRGYLRSGLPDIGAYEFNGLDAPTLAISSQPANVVLSWPANYIGYRLQSTLSLTAGLWITKSNEVLSGTSWVVTNSLSRPSQFFRLVK